jgi:hypothetical protein
VEEESRRLLFYFLKHFRLNRSFGGPGGGGGGLRRREEVGGESARSDTRGSLPPPPPCNPMTQPVVAFRVGTRFAPRLASADRTDWYASGGVGAVGGGTGGAARAIPSSPSASPSASLSSSPSARWQLISLPDRCDPAKDGSVHVQAQKEKEAKKRKKDAGGNRGRVTTMRVVDGVSLSSGSHCVYLHLPSMLPPLPPPPHGHRWQLAEILCRESGGGDGGEIDQIGGKEGREEGGGGKGMANKAARRAAFGPTAHSKTACGRAACRSLRSRMIWTRIIDFVGYGKLSDRLLRGKRQARSTLQAAVCRDYRRAYTDAFNGTI